MEQLQELISLFLKINPEPSDQQFHALAEACGVDKETLESISYEMLGEAEDMLEDPAEYATAPSTAVPNEDPLDVVEATAPSTSLSYGDDGEDGGATHTCDEPTIPVSAAARRLKVMAEHGFEVDADSQTVLDETDVDPDDLSLSDVAMNDGDPTDDDLGLQDETLDDGFTEDDKGAGLVNNVTDVLTDDGVPDTSI